MYHIFYQDFDQSNLINILVAIGQAPNAQWVTRWTLPKSLSFAPSYPFYSFYHPHRYSKDTFSTILKNSSPFNSEVHSTVQLRLPVIRKLPDYKSTNYSQSCFQFIYAKMIRKHEMWQIKFPVPWRNSFNPDLPPPLPDLPPCYINEVSIKMYFFPDISEPIKWSKYSLRCRSPYANRATTWRQSSC